MAGWLKIGETLPYNRTGDSWVVKFYKIVTSAGTNYSNLRLITDINLRRGKQNTKDKSAGILATKTTFALRDTDSRLSYHFTGSKDDDLVGKIYKNGVLFFVGKMLLLSPKKDSTLTSPIIKLKIYDGLSKLNSPINHLLFPTGRGKITEFLRVIFKILSYSINIKVYQSILAGTVADQAIPLEKSYCELSDFYKHDVNLTYSKLLNYLIAQFQWQVFQLNGNWIIRQIGSINKDGVNEIEIDYYTGAVTNNGSVSVAATLLESSCVGIPLLSQGNVYNKMEISQPCFDPSEIIEDFFDGGGRCLRNSMFILKGAYWNIFAGTPKFGNSALVMKPGDEVYQETDSLPAQTIVRVGFMVNCVRMILDTSDNLSNFWENPLVKIEFHADGGTIYYWRGMYGTGEWETVDYERYVFGKDIGRHISENFSNYRVEGLNYEIDIALPSEDGKMRIYLIGGGVASGNNYPKEGVTFSVAYINLVDDTTVSEENKNNPESYQVEAVVGDGNLVKKIEIPFADLDPYNKYFWHLGYDYVDQYLKMQRTTKWITDLGTMSLLEWHARKLLSLHQESGMLEVALQPGLSLNINAIITSSIGGHTKDYLPIYENTKLIADEKQFILIEHNHNAVDQIVVANYTRAIDRSNTENPALFPALLSTNNNEVLDYEHKPTYQFIFSNFPLSAKLFDLFPNYIIAEMEVFVVTAFNNSATLELSVGGSVVVASTKIRLANLGRSSVKPPAWNRQSISRAVTINLGNSPTTGEMVVIIKVREVDYNTTYEAL